eukprot:4043002-Alexandrium_andersonii.AAC.1
MLGWAWGGLGHGALVPSAATVPSTHWDELARAVGARVVLAEYDEDHVPTFMDVRTHLLPLASTHAGEAAQWVELQSTDETTCNTDPEPDGECPICLTADSGAGWQKLQCGHTFHFGCMARHRDVGRDAG